MPARRDENAGNAEKDKGGAETPHGAPKQDALPVASQLLVVDAGQSIVRGISSRGEAVGAGVCLLFLGVGVHRRRGTVPLVDRVPG